MAKRHACIVCGRKIARAIKLPAGKIYLCTDSDCKRELQYHVSDKSVSLAGLDYETFDNHEVVCKEAVDFFRNDPVTLIELASDVSEYIWAGETLGEMFHEAVVDASQKLEKNWVAAVKDSDLPLIPMTSLKSEEARSLLENRLKGV